MVKKIKRNNPLSLNNWPGSTCFMLIIPSVIKCQANQSSSLLGHRYMNRVWMVNLINRVSNPLLTSSTLLPLQSWFQEHVIRCPSTSRDVHNNQSTYTYVLKICIWNVSHLKVFHSNHFVHIIDYQTSSGMYICILMYTYWIICIRHWLINGAHEEYAKSFYVTPKSGDECITLTFQGSNYTALLAAELLLDNQWSIRREWFSVVIAICALPSRPPYTQPMLKKQIKVCSMVPCRTKTLVKCCCGGCSDLCSPDAFKSENVYWPNDNGAGMQEKTARCWNGHCVNFACDWDHDAHKQHKQPIWDTF